MLKIHWEDLENESKRFSRLSIDEQVKEKVQMAKMQESSDYRQEIEMINRESNLAQFSNFSTREKLKRISDNFKTLNRIRAVK